MIIFASTKKNKLLLRKNSKPKLLDKKDIKICFLSKKKKNRMARYTYNTLETKPKSSTSITSPADISWS